MIAGEREVTTRAETMAALRRSASDMVYDVNGDDVREVDDHAALIVGSIRYRTRHGFAIHQRSWLLTFRDGLVYRVIVFNDADEALRAYGRLGVEMGLPTPFDLALSRDADPAAS